MSQIGRMLEIREGEERDVHEVYEHLQDILKALKESVNPACKIVVELAEDYAEQVYKGVK